MKSMLSVSSNFIQYMLDQTFYTFHISPPSSQGEYYNCNPDGIPNDLGGQNMHLKNMIIISIVSIIVVSLSIQMSINSDTTAEKKSYCMTDEQFEAAFSERFDPTLRDDIKLPTYMPEGYSLQCKHVDHLQLFFIYAKEPIQTADMEELLRVHDAIILTINDETPESS